MYGGCSGRLSKGAVTHLASWLQEVSALTASEGQALLDASEPAGSSPRGERARAGLREARGKQAGHAKPITDVATSGELIVTKDPRSMRLWRASRDFPLLRVVTCSGRHVAFSPTGQFIVTGTRGAAAVGEDGSCVPAGGLKIWGPAGGWSKARITTGVAVL